MAAPGRQWGTTAPLSENLPQPEELEASNALVEELKRENNFESTEDTAKRSESMVKNLTFEAILILADLLRWHDCRILSRYSLREL